VQIKTILLTGATGFLGSNLLRMFVDQGYQVVIIKRANSSLTRIKGLVNSIKSYDLEETKLREVFEQNNIDCIVHVACNYGRRGEEASEVLSVNTMFGVELLDCAVSFGVEVFINTDTFLRGASIYAISKSHFIDYLKFFSKKIRVINMRLEHMYGVSDDDTKFVAWVISQFIDGAECIRLTSGRQLRDFIYVDDVVSAYETILKSLDLLSDFSEFEVGSGKLTSIRELVEKIESVLVDHGYAAKVRLDFGAISYRENEAMAVDVNIAPLKALGWRPTVDLDLGLNKIIKAEKKFKC
jgi:CDP-paratose synthetase